MFCEKHRGTTDKSSILIETLHSLMGFEISGRGNQGERGKNMDTVAWKCLRKRRKEEKKK